MNPDPKRRYGQHFLRDTGIINRVVALIGPTPGDLIIEVGGGDGALSAMLAPLVFRLLCFEIDHDLIPALSEALLPYPNAVVLAQDILSADLSAILSAQRLSGVRLRVAGNLPYNIGTAIIEKLLSEPLPIEDMIFMLQLETAERISASPGSKEYGFFSVYCQHFCSVTLGFKVSPACFVPRPKVYSAIVTLRPRSLDRDPILEHDFLEVAKAAFAHRRKKLANSLQRARQFGPSSAEILSRAGIDGARRAEDLSVEEFERLAAVYHEFKPRAGSAFSRSAN